jgi:hypothetical protein
MKRPELNRRDFNKLAAAAFGGVVAGTAIGCGGKSESKSGNAGDVAEKHICKGLNTCKGKGADGKNDCKGKGTCATVAKHECGTKNECKGQGGCGDNAGKNECKEKGGCAIPLMDEKWKEVKAAFDKKHDIK